MSQSKPKTLKLSGKRKKMLKVGEFNLHGVRVHFNLPYGILNHWGERFEIWVAKAATRRKKV